MSPSSAFLDNKYLQWLAAAGISIWFLWVVLQYIGYHPAYVDLLADHPFSGLLVALGVVVIGLSVWSFRRLGVTPSVSVAFRGWQLIGLVCLLSVSIVLVFKAVVKLKQATPGETFIFFTIYSLGYMVLLLLLALGLLAIGKIVVRYVDKEIENSLVLIGVGLSVVGTISVLFGLLGLLYGALIAVVLLAAMAVERKAVWEVLQSWLVVKHSLPLAHWWTLPTFFIGLVVVALYWAGGIKAFPTGFDGAALYANLAHLTANYHALPGAFQPFAWSVIMSWGELLYGSAAFSLILSHFMFLPALAMGYFISLRWLQPSYALLAVVTLLTFPAIGFHAMVDEKIDLGLLFMCLVALEMLLGVLPKISSAAHTPGDTFFKNPVLKPLLLIGWILGFGFTIKYTAVFMIIALVVLVFYTVGGQLLYWASLAIFTGILFLAGFYEWGNIAVSSQEATGLGGALVVAGLVTIGYRHWRKKVLLPQLFSAVMGIVIGAFLAFLPWGMKHLAENDYAFSLSSLLYGKPDTPQIDIPYELLSNRFNVAPSLQNDYHDYIRLTSKDDKKQSSKSNDFTSTEKEQNLMGDAKREELQRYLGYEGGFWLYASVPFDATFNINIQGLRHQDIGFLFLAFLPLLLLGWVGKRGVVAHIVVVGMGIIWLSACFWSLTEASDWVSHIESSAKLQQKYYAPDAGILALVWASAQQPFIWMGGQLAGFFAAISEWPFIVYLPISLLLLIGLVQVVRRRASSWLPAFKHVGVVAVAFAWLWLFFGNAIVWYALPLWVLLLLLLTYYYQETKTLAGVRGANPIQWGVGFLFLAHFSIFVPVAFSSGAVGAPSNFLFNWPMITYLSKSDVSERDALKMFAPTVHTITQVINQDRNAKVYRINSYMQFHIDNNDRRVYEDNQLGRFDQITSQLAQKSDFFEVLKANGIRYIVYDINSPSLDQTPEKSLRRKCQTFLELATSTPAVELLTTDNYIENNATGQPLQLPNGQTAKVSPGLMGKTLVPGSIALFRIN